MRNITWYELDVRFKGNEPEIIEKKVKEGKYGHRREVQPLLYIMDKKLKETKKMMNTIYKEIDIMRHQFDKQKDEKNIQRCLDMMSKIKSIIPK